ncbi:hypothetical protein Cni_G16971 [Canna indica]|uniref:Uncharacterized protein n=1 Tax=Canna indica TaxID=4628 RepID=A0AAQ3QEN9_9LILI|nr:hypothetical protein Cni_G16971 [Canna indica]
MAVAMESFSIREYTAKMRGVDYDKCWPFSEERGGRTLPPMPVQKFRWWADEVRMARLGGEGGDRVDQEKKATVDEAADGREDPMVETARVARACDATEASVEERPLRTLSSRAKPRTPKKRSILELFAVAPPVRGVQERDKRDIEGGGKQQGVTAVAATHSNLGNGDGRDSFEQRKRKKRVQEGAKMLKEKIGAKQKLKAKAKPMKRKKKHKNEILAAKKEKTCKLKMPSPLDVCKIVKNNVYEKQVGKMHKRLVHKQTNPATIRSLLKKHIFRLVRTSKLVSRSQEVSRMPAANSIVKKRKRGTSSKKRKITENTKGGDLVELYCDSTKHLCFSGKDDNLVHGASCLPLELPHLKTLCKLVSDVLAASSTMDNLHRCSSATEGTKLNTNDKEACINLNGKGVITSNVETGENSSEMQSNGHLGHTTTTNSSITKKTPMVEILDLNHPVKDHVDINCMNLDGSTLIPSPTYSSDLNAQGPMNKVRLESVPGSFQEQSCSVISDHLNNLHDPIGRPASVSDTNSVLSLTRNQDKQHWVSCFDQRCMDSTEGKTHLLGPAKDVCNGLPGFQQMYHKAKDSGIGTCSSVGHKAIIEPTSNLGPIWRDKCAEEGFIGLPLNSQGELIQLHPGTRYGFCQVDKMPKSALNSLQILPSSSHFQQPSHIWTKGKFPFVPSYHDDDQNWSVKQYYPARKVVFSELGSVELQGLEKMKSRTYDEKAHFKHTDPRQMEFSHCGCRDQIHTESCFNRMKFHSEKDLELGIGSAIQPTMRLMGKNVTVGSYSKEYHGCNDGRVWTDKEIITTSCPSIRVYNRPLLNRWHEEECIVQAESGASRDIPFTSLDVPSNYCCMPADKFAANYMQIGFGSDWMLSDGNSSSSGGRGFHIDLAGSPVPCQSFLNRASHFAVDCNPETQSVDMGKRKTLWAAYPPNFCQHVLVNSTHCKRSQSISYGVPSTASYSPYIDQVPAQSSRGHSLQKLPHWMLDSANQHPRYIPYPTAAYQSCTIPANSGFHHASPYTRPVVPFPCSSNSSSQAYGSYAPSSVVYPSSMTALTTNDFSSVSSTYGDKIKAKDGIVFNFTHIKSQDQSKRCRKRSASKDDKIIEAVKRPNLKLQEDSNTPVCVRREQLLGEQENIGTSEVNACVSRTTDDSLCVADNEKDTVVVSCGFPLKASQTRSGPIKLSAGAKHILKPNGSLDQENSRPIYLTVPFTQGTTAGKDSNPQEKAAKVYRF